MADLWDHETGRRSSTAEDRSIPLLGGRLRRHQHLRLLPPGILYGRFGTRAAVFVTLTLLVFVLLAIKYTEVAEAGGVVTIGTRAFHPYVGLPGGMFILVDYFLSAALSALSGVIYLSAVFKALAPVVVLGTVG